MTSPTLPLAVARIGFRSRGLWLASLLSWSAFALLQSALSWVYFHTNEPPGPSFRGIAVVTFAETLAWIVGSPFIVALTARHPVSGRAALGRTPLHLALATLIHVGAALGDYVSRCYYGLEHFPGIPSMPWNGIVTRMLPWDAMRYLFVVAIALTFLSLDALRRQELETVRLRADLSEARLATLRMQLNPHLIFNALHAISELVYRDARLADRSLTRLADLLRRALDRAGQEEITLADELEFLREYLEIEKMRFGDTLMVSIDVPDALLGAAVPTLLLQPLVENAVRHGVRRVGHGRIEVRVSAPGDDLRIAVCDDGPGWPAGPPRERVGLSITRTRLAGLYGERARLTLADAPGGGAHVELRIPRRMLAPEVARHGTGTP